MLEQQDDPDVGVTSFLIVLLPSPSYLSGY